MRKTQSLLRQPISKNFGKIGHFFLEKSFLKLKICGIEKIAFKVLVPYYSECRLYKFMKVLVFGTKCSTVYYSVLASFNVLKCSCLICDTIGITKSFLPLGT